MADGDAPDTVTQGTQDLAQQQAMTEQTPIGGTPVNLPRPQQQQPIRAPNLTDYRMPLIAQLISGIANANKPMPNQQPGQPPMMRPSRLDAFEDFLGNFMYSLSQGMAASGHGPGSNLRGAAAAIGAPMQRDVQQYGLNQNAANMQAQREAEQARTELTQEQTKIMGNVVQTPYGPMSQSLAGKVFPAAIAAQGKVQAAGVQKKYISTPAGIFDTTTGKAVEGGSAVKISQDDIDNHGIPAPFLDKTITAQQYASLERGGAMEQANVIRSRQADIAAGHLSLANKVFERDTFGTLFGKDIPSSLVDMQGNTIGWKSPAAPTSSIKTQAQQAQDLNVIFDKVSKKIDQLDAQGKLGPYAGRISELMTGKVGADDPDFAELRALGSLTASGMLKAHFGSRGGQQMYGHFEDLFNTGKMTSGDLKGAMRGFRTFMGQYANRANTAGSKGGGPAKGGGNIKFTPIGPG